MHSRGPALSRTAPRYKTHMGKLGGRKGEGEKETREKIGRKDERVEKKRGRRKEEERDKTETWTQRIER